MEGSGAPCLLLSETWEARRTRRSVPHPFRSFIAKRVGTMKLGPGESSKFSVRTPAVPPPRTETRVPPDDDVPQPPIHPKYKAHVDSAESHAPARFPVTRLSISLPTEHTPACSG